LLHSFSWLLTLDILEATYIFSRPRVVHRGDGFQIWKIAANV